MKNLIHVSLLLAISLSVWGQGTGHPGGGGPDTTIKEADLHCEALAHDTEILEKKFTKSWNKDYKSSKDFTDLIDRIMIENLIHGLHTIESLKHKRPNGCDNGKTHIAKFNIHQRPDFQQELKLLKQIEQNWIQGARGMIDSSKCGKHFTERKQNIDHLKNVIKLYDGQKRE